MKHKRTHKKNRVIGLKTATWRDIVYIVFSLFIMIGLIKTLTAPGFVFAPTATAENILSPIPANPVREAAVPQPIRVDDITRWEGLKLAIRKIAPIYGIDPKLGIAQAALESGRGTSEYCVERNNCFGIAAYDWNPDEAWYFYSMEEGVIEYYRLQRNNFPEAWANRDNPELMLELLVNNSSGLKYATDPEYVLKIRNLPEWREN